MTKKYFFSLFMMLIAISSNAQLENSGSFGSTYVPSNGFISIFGSHTFDFADCGLFPGLILTERAGDPGIVNFTSTASWTDASDESHIDGYARTFSNGPFVFPVGDEGNLRMIGISGSEDAMAAYNLEDPAMITGELIVTNLDLDAVSTREYWRLVGDNQTVVTLTWDQISNIEDLVDGDINKLTIIGWTDAGWVVIPSIINGFFLQSNSQNVFDDEISTSFLIGSLSSMDPINPDDFEVLSFGSLAVPRASIVSDGEINVFPNPAKLGTPTYVSYNLMGSKGKLEIYDGFNKLVYSKLLGTTTGNILLPELNLIDDRYVVTLVEQDGSKTSSYLIVIK